MYSNSSRFPSSSFSSSIVSTSTTSVGAFRGERIDQVHEEQTVRILDTEHGPRMVARAVPLVAGEHDVPVPPAGHAVRSSGSRISSGGGPRAPGRRYQVQGMGVGAEVLRDRSADPRLHDQPDGMGRQLVVSSVLQVNLLTNCGHLILIRRRKWLKKFYFRLLFSAQKLK